MRTHKPAWALRLALKLREWLDAHNVTGAWLGRRLAIPSTKWSSVLSGTAISYTEVYLRLYCYTQIPEADPRTIPPRKSGSGYIVRKVDDPFLNTWLENNGKKFQLDPELLASQPIPINIDHRELDRHLLSTIGILEEYINATQEEVETLFQQHGKLLGKVYKLTGALSLEAPEDRTIALLALRRLK